MDHFINIPIDNTGLLPDNRLAAIVSEAMQTPFDFTDIFVYSHGWWTTATDAMADYSHFSIDFLKTACSMSPALVSTPPKSCLGVGIHWPSTLSENHHEIINLFEPFTFYQMEKRSDVIGQNALYALLRLMYETRNKSPDRLQFRLTLIGHSFGCRVICRAIQTLISDLLNISIEESFRTFVITTTMKVVLLQPAIDCTDFERNGAYGNLVRLPLLTMLTTRSDLDYALKNLFPLAEHINFLSKRPGSRIAMGFAGPSPVTFHDWHGQSLSLLPCYNPTATALLPPPKRLLVADLTQIHRASESVSSALTGHHSDIFHPEIYKLIAKFVFE